MQHYQIEISPTSNAQIDETFSYVFTQSPQRAKTWLTKIYKKIYSLETFPHRCGLIRENEAFKTDVRGAKQGQHPIVAYQAGAANTAITIEHHREEEPVHANHLNKHH